MRSEGEKGEHDPGSDPTELPAIDFSTFILSLSTTALYQMGHVADPDTGNPVEANHVIAQQTIDTLEMIREKTRGNLEPEEAKLIDSLLYELRLQFLKSAN
ncbi:MAG: DUF1844 domain-containing protein [Myxococcota bacterium]|nr:DUF1844 domain-containing protein [Myxococcota bacterium]